MTTLTTEEIVRMAREAGFHADCFDETSIPFYERFADRVASAEREACAKVCDELAEDIHNAADCAAAIRARSAT